MKFYGKNCLITARLMVTQANRSREMQMMSYAGEVKRHATILRARLYREMQKMIRLGFDFGVINTMIGDDYSEREAQLGIEKELVELGYDTHLTKTSLEFHIHKISGNDSLGLRIVK